MIDDGGFDSFVLPSGTVTSNLQVRRSVDSTDTALYVNGQIEAVVTDAVGENSAERVQIDGSVYSIDALSFVSNSAPQATGKSVLIKGRF